MKTIGCDGYPRWAEHLLQSLGADPAFTDEVLGDLAEEYLIRARWDGRTAARRWYYGEALRTAPHLLRNWRDRLTARDVGESVPALLWSTLAGFAAHGVALSLIGVATQWLIGVPARVYFNHAVGSASLGLLAAVLLIGRCATGMTAGWIAGLVNRRAPILASLVVAGIHFSLSVATMFAVPSITLPLVIVFSVTNLALALSCLAGGAFAALRHQRGPTSDVASGVDRKQTH